MSYDFRFVPPSKRPKQDAKVTVNTTAELKQELQRLASDLSYDSVNTFVLDMIEKFGLPAARHEVAMRKKKK